MYTGPYILKMMLNGHFKQIIKLGYKFSWNSMNANWLKS